MLQPKEMLANAEQCEQMADKTDPTIARFWRDAAKQWRAMAAQSELTENYKHVPKEGSPKCLSKCLPPQLTLATWPSGRGIRRRRTGAFHLVRDDVSVRPFGRKNAHLRIARTADCEREHQSKHQRSTALNYISVSLVAYRPIERRPLAIPLLPRQAASDHLRIFAGIDLDKRPARIALRVGDL